MEIKDLWLKLQNIIINIAFKLDRSKTYKLELSFEVIEERFPDNQDGTTDLIYICKNIGACEISNPEGKKVKVFTGKSEAQKTRLAMLDYYTTAHGGSDDGFDGWYINLQKTIRKNISVIEKFY